jgi:radical SAM superfamily enzyme YgiQ (UPF0313 family)
MSESVLNVIQITEALKARTTATIVWGGVHATIKPIECLKFADVVCVGEGEGAVVELASRVESNLPCDDIPGVWTKTGKHMIRPLIQDMDSLPFPDHDYTRHYIRVGNHIQRMNQALLTEYTQDIYYAIPTRGCPHACTYCSNNTLNKLYPGQRIFRKRSPKNVIQELVQVKNTLPISRIFFDDDAFFMQSVEDIRSFSQSYKDQIGLPLTIMGATPATITEEKLSPLVDAGLSEVRMGIQSASENTKKLYNRKYSNEQMSKAANILSSFYPKISKVDYDIILDNPWETENDLKETLMFLSTLKPPFTLIFYALEYYPGTDLHERAVKEGFVEDTDEATSSSSYLGVKKTYLNKLFLLVGDCAQIGVHVTPCAMSTLIQRGLKARVIYTWFYSQTLINKLWLSLGLVQQAWRDVLKGDFSRIIGYIMTRHVIPFKKKLT